MSRHALWCWSLSHTHTQSCALIASPLLRRLRSNKAKLQTKGPESAHADTVLLTTDLLMTMDLLTSYRVMVISLGHNQVQDLARHEDNLLDCLALSELSHVCDSLHTHTRTHACHMLAASQVPALGCTLRRLQTNTSYAHMMICAAFKTHTHTCPHLHMYTHTCTHTHIWQPSRPTQTVS